MTHASSAALAPAPCGDEQSHDDDMLARAVERLCATRDAVAALYVERDPEAELLALSVAARTHLTLVGEPGNAKTQIVRDFCRAIEGARYFETLLAADSPAQRVLGPYSIPALDEGRFEFATEGMLPEAHLALLDEGYRANATLLDNLLALANERVLHNGPQVVASPLWTLVIACNQLPPADDERTQAFRDRIALTKIVRPVATNEGRRAIIAGQIARRRRGDNPAGAAQVAIADIERVQQAVPRVALPEEFVADALTLWRAGEEEGLSVSARRFGELVKLCQARAVLADRSMCISEDLTLARHLLWSDPDDEPTAYEVTLAFASPWARRAAELHKALGELLAEAGTLLPEIERVPLEEETPAELSDRAQRLARRVGALAKKTAKARTDAPEEVELSRIDDETGALVARLQRAVYGL